MDPLNHAPNYMGLLANLICSQTKLPLDTAVATSCGCKINESAAKSLYGPMSWQDKCEKQAPCPICKTKVTAYYSDTPTRIAVRDFFDGFPKGIDSFKKMFMCPLSPSRNLNDAVNLISCCHKISQFMATIVYGKNPSAPNKRPCDTCQKEVKAYFPDKFFRAVSSGIANLEEAYAVAANLQIRASLLGAIRRHRLIFNSRKFQDLFVNNSFFVIPANTDFYMTNLNPNLCNWLREKQRMGELEKDPKTLGYIIDDTLFLSGLCIKSLDHASDFQLSVNLEDDAVLLRVKSQINMHCRQETLYSTLPNLFDKMIREGKTKLTLQSGQRLFLTRCDTKIMNEAFFDSDLSLLFNHYAPKGYSLSVHSEDRIHANPDGLCPTTLVLKSRGGLEFVLTKI